MDDARQLIGNVPAICGETFSQSLIKKASACDNRCNVKLEK